MANNQTEATERPLFDTEEHELPIITEKRAHNKFGLGVGLTLVAVLLLLGSFFLIWLGVFPGLIAIVIAIPMATYGVRLVREGEPSTMTQR